MPPELPKCIINYQHTEVALMRVQSLTSRTMLSDGDIGGSISTAVGFQHGGGHQRSRSLRGSNRIYLEGRMLFSSRLWNEDWRFLVKSVWRDLWPMRSRAGGGLRTRSKPHNDAASRRS